MSDNPLAFLNFLRDDTPLAYMVDVLLVGLAFLFALFALISLGQLGPAYQQGANASIVYALFNIATLVWILAAFATRSNPNSFVRFVGLGFKAPVYVILIILGVVIGIIFSPVGHAAVFGFLHPAGTAASPDIITSFFFKNYEAPVSETYFIIGCLFPFLYWVLGGRGSDLKVKLIAFLAAMAISCAAITVMHLVIFSTTLDQLPGLFLFFAIQGFLAFVFSSIAPALGMHFGFNLAIPGVVMQDEMGIEYAPYCEPSLDQLMISHLKQRLMEF